MSVLLIGNITSLFPIWCAHHPCLEELPESLDETYEWILREINRASREHDYRHLHYLAMTIRPLRVEELAEVLVVDFNARGVPKINASWRWEDNEEAVLSRPP